MHLSGLGVTGLYTRSFYYLVNILTFIESVIRIVGINKADICIKKIFSCV